MLQKRKVFYDIWNGNALGIRTVEFPIAVKEKLISYRKHDTLDCDFLENENIFQCPNIFIKEASANYDIPILKWDWSTFDWLDFLATILGGVVGQLLQILLIILIL